MLQDVFKDLYRDFQLETKVLGCRYGVQKSLMHDKLKQVFKYLRGKHDADPQYKNIDGLFVRSKFFLLLFCFLFWVMLFTL